MESMNPPGFVDEGLLLVDFPKNLLVECARPCVEECVPHLPPTVANGICLKALLFESTRRPQRNIGNGGADDRHRCTVGDHGSRGIGIDLLGNGALLPPPE